MDSDEYVLGRTAGATSRLNLQHFLFTTAFGYILHPCIPASSSTVAIADIGTGSGIWLCSLSNQVSSTAALHGYDVSAEQFISSATLPTNLTLSVADAFSSPSNALKGKYDVVHIRLFLCVVRGNDPRPLIDHAMMLLKPGGYLQWEEIDGRAQRVVSNKGAPVVHLAKIALMPGNPHEKTWVGDLPDTLDSAGMYVEQVVRTKGPPWMAQMWMDNKCLVSEEWASSGLAKLRQSGKEHSTSNGDLGDRFRDVFNITKAARAEAELGGTFEQVMQMVVARKPI